MKMKWELQQVESSLVYCAGVCVCVCICGEEEISFRLMRRGDSWWRTHKHANNITLKWHRRKKEDKMRLRMVTATATTMMVATADRISI